MPSPYKEIPITFEKGLVTEIEESLLDVGQASELENWEPSANGALRARNAWSSISKDGLPSTYKVRGFGAIATGGSSGSVSAPLVIQTSKWPDSTNQDPVATKTGTLNGCTIGNIAIAVVCVNSTEAPTVTGGWTERAVSTGNNQKVRFYTKTIANSTEAFTYTISSTLIRSLTVYEVAYLDAEDPGTKWAAATQSGGGSGSATLTVNTTDTDGGLVLSGYTYDGGTPATTDSGTSGLGATSMDDGNTRTGVYITDLDQLDGAVAGTGAYTSPSWTPPSSGTMLVVVMGYGTTSWAISTVTGNSLTWTVVNVGTGTVGCGYAWADLSGGSTTGAITVTPTGTGMRGQACFFYHIAGGPAGVSPVQQSISGSNNGNPVSVGLTNNLQTGSGYISSATHYNTANNANFDPVSSAADFESTTPDDVLSFVNSSMGGNQYFKTAHRDSQPVATNKSPDWSNPDGTPSLNIMQLEILGNGGASQARHGTYTTSGTAIEGYDYVANKDITAKMVAWGYTPPAAVDNTINFYITLALALSSTEYRIYRILRDSIESGTWENIDTVNDATSTDPWVSFAQGSGYLGWTSTGLLAPRLITLATLTAANISGMTGKAGRAMAYHKDRMFVAGATDTPSRVYFSDIGLPTSFTVVTDYLDIGGDDGEAIQGVVSVEGLLLIGKTNRAYLVSGSGIESFFVNELSGGTAAVGSPIVRTPYGTILAGTDDIWVVQGGGVDPMSRPLGSGYVITGSVSTAYAQDSALICDSATGQVWRVNLVTGAWAIESVTGADAAVYMLFSLNGRHYYGVNDSTVEVGGTRKLSDARTFDETTGGTTFVGATGRVALLGPSVKYTPRWLFLQTRNHDIAHPNQLYVDIESDHGVTTKTVTVESATQRDRIDIPREHTGSEWIKLTFRAQSSAIAGAIDPERLVLGVDVEAPR